VSNFLLFAFKAPAQRPLPEPLPPPAGTPPTPAPLPIIPIIPAPTGDTLAAEVAEFLADWNGKFVPPRFGGNYQCVALVNEWVASLNLPLFPRLAAAGDFIYRNIPNFVFIANTPTNVPQAGDIIEWGRSTTLPWGHIGVFLRGDVMHLVTFDQNWPMGSPAHEQAHTYVGVSGWHRPLNWS
jgi:hypothetical protein